MALRTDWKTGDTLSHNDLNLITATINNDTATISTATTDNATTKAGLTSVQTIATKSQGDITTLQQTQTTTQNSLNAANAAMTVIQNRLTVLETATPPPAVPNAVASFSLGATTNTTQVLSWTAPSGGATPTFYDSRYKVAGTGTWSAGPSVAAGTLTTTITGLTSGENYDYSVVTRNAAGPGAASATLTKRTTTSFTPSPAGTTIPPATQIVMHDGGVVTLSGGQIFLNGSPMGTTGQVILIYVNAAGVVYQENSELYWWYWDPTQADPWVFTSDPRAAPPVSGVSPGGTTIPPASQIVMNDGGIVTLSGGIIYLNGAPMGDSGQVILLYIDNAHVVHQENSENNWWYWDGSTWQEEVGDPRVNTGTPSGAPPPAAAAGYNRLIFQDDFTTNTTIAPAQYASSGYNWYWGLWTGNNGVTCWSVNTGAHASGSLASSAGGIVTFTGPGFPNEAVLSVPAYFYNSGGGDGSLPTTGIYDHVYVEAYLQFDPRGDLRSGYDATPGEQIGGRGGWPAWWSWTIQYLNGYGFGGAGGQMSGNEGTEIDFMEAFGGIFGGGSQYGEAIHEWPSGAGDGTGYYDVDSNWHAYGMCWTRLSGGRAKVEFFFDNNSRGSLTLGAGTQWPALEGDKLFLILGTGQGWPMQCDYVRVWGA